MTRWRQASAKRLGETLGSGWVLESVIGSGGTATVYRAAGREGRTAAVKVMHEHLVGNWSRRFEREARLLCALREPAIVKLYEFGRRSQVPYLVLELLSGKSLDRVLFPAELTQKTAAILTHARQALAALAVVHSHGVLHRDLKPSNLFLTSNGSLKVLDFGAAGSEQRDVTRADSLTSGLLGTPAFMPPEQALGRWDLVDQRSDVWSLAAVIFTLLSGEHVHPARTRNEQLGRAMASSARPIRSVLPKLDARTAAVLDRALSYRREDRFQSATAFREALEQRDAALELVSCSPSTQSTLRERRSPLSALRSSRAPALGVAALALALIADVRPSGSKTTLPAREVRSPNHTKLTAAADVPPAAVVQPAVRLVDAPRVAPGAPTLRMSKGAVHQVRAATPLPAPAPAPRDSGVPSSAPVVDQKVNPLDLRLGSNGDFSRALPQSQPAAGSATPELGPTPLDVRN